MARITIEDCLHQDVENQFELVLIAAKRARRLANGAEALVDWQNDKPTVVALREIAEGKVSRDLLLEADPEPAGRLPRATVRPRRLTGDLPLPRQGFTRWIMRPPC
jgi:DNA-directed RNA polymerase subunit omega